MAEKELQLLVERGYQRALEAGEIIHLPDGAQEFTCHLPEPINEECVAVRSPDGAILLLLLKDFHAFPVQEEE